jgi:hypothetical protein
LQRRALRQSSRRLHVGILRRDDRLEKAPVVATSLPSGQSRADRPRRMRGSSSTIAFRRCIVCLQTSNDFRCCRSRTSGFGPRERACVAKVAGRRNGRHSKQAASTSTLVGTLSDLPRADFGLSVRRIQVRQRWLIRRPTITRSVATALTEPTTNNRRGSRHGAPASAAR